ncbi:hypothetical protein JTB14_021031 [Gonioctena quinquepunctata]|nr:hypothetical protein JTB14_021031 [Gonioctena quinquepunctata]
MASQEEDNKLECISNVNKELERYFLNVYKKHEYILSNKNETFEKKIESLIEVWKSVGELNLTQFDVRHVIRIMDWAKPHALDIVLTAEWNKFKASYQSTLLDAIDKAQTELLKVGSIFATRCKKLADVVRNPWEDPVLMTLMKTKDAEIGVEEIEFFCEETAYLVSVRLKKLCESHCEDLALNLVTAFMNCNKLAKSQNLNLNATDKQMWFIFDIYIALLYKFQEKQKIVFLLKELSFEEGLQLVNRFAKKRVKIAKIWKNCQRVAILATQMYISQAVVKYTEELKEFVESYLEMYIALCSTESLMQEFPTCIRRISNLADAAGLYVFCEVIRKKAGTDMKPLLIEMYIRALTTDMNELERQKDSNETEKAAATTSRLAAAFCNLADYLDEHVKVARECVLTAFSLDPTKERLSAIETLARRSGFQVLDTGQEWKCKLHPPALPSDDVAWICPECGEWMCRPDFNAPIKINMALNEALQKSVLGISEALCDDLVVCLSNPRYQILSWFLPWDDLHRLCIMYLQDPQTTKNFVTELKFVDIDYSIFKGIKREPLDELAGIERGYEQYLDHDFVSDEESTSNSEDSMSQDSRPYSLGSDGAGDGPYLPTLLPQPKSDPNTLKSLRMFRPNLKRSREKESEEGTPEKLYKTDTSNANSPASISNAEETSKTDISSSLNEFLDGVSPSDLPAVPFPQLAIQYPPSSIALTDASNNENSHSKNVKTATLPLLGGQVAGKDIPTIQVNKTLQNRFQEKTKQYPSTTRVQAFDPPNGIKIRNTMETTKTYPSPKTLNKPLQNGSRESKPPKTSDSKSQDFCLPIQEDTVSTSCPVLSVHLEKSQATQFQCLLKQKLGQEQPTPLHQSDMKQPKQHISQIPQKQFQHIASETQQTNQNLKQLSIPLNSREKFQLKHSFHPKQLKINLFQSPSVEQSIKQTIQTPRNNYSQKSIIQCLSLDPQLQTLPIPDMEQLPKINQTSAGTQLRVRLVNIEKLKGSSPPNPDRSRHNSVNRDQLQLPNLKAQKTTPLSRYSTFNSSLQAGSATNFSNIEKQAPSQSGLGPRQISIQFNSGPETKSFNQARTVANPSVTQSQNSGKQFSPPSGPSPRQFSSPSQSEADSKSLSQTRNYPGTYLTNIQISKGRVKSDSVPHPTLGQAQNQSPKQERLQTTQPSQPVLKTNLVQMQNQVIQDQLQTTQVPSQHQSQLVISQEHSQFQSTNLERLQKNCTQPTNLNLPQKQLDNQEEKECKLKQLENCFKLQQSQPVKEENVMVNNSHHLQKTYCSLDQIPNQEKQSFRQDTSPTNYLPNQQQSESNLEKAEKQQTQPEQVPEDHKLLEDNSKCSFNQDQKQNQSITQEKLQVSLPLNAEQLQIILKQIPVPEHVQSPLVSQEKSPKIEKPQENRSLQHIKLSISSSGTATKPKQQATTSGVPGNVAHHSQTHFQSGDEITTNQINHSLKPNQSQSSSYSSHKAHSLSPNSEKLQVSRSSKSNLKTTPKHKLAKAFQQEVHNQNNLCLVSPKVGKTPCTLKRVPSQSISLEAEVLPNLDKIQSNYTPSQSMEAKSPSPDKLQARLWPGSEQAINQEMDIDKPQPWRDLRVVLGNIFPNWDKESPRSCLEKKNSYTTLEVTNKSDDSLKSDEIVCKPDGELQCNSDGGNDDEGGLRNGNVFTEGSCEIGSEKTAKVAQNLSEISSGIFSDLSEGEYEELFVQNNHNFSVMKECLDMSVYESYEELPKNSNLTENIRTYTKKSKKALFIVKKDCYKTLIGDDKLNVCKNVNSIRRTDKLHSIVQNSPTNQKELKVILCRLTSNRKLGGKCTSNKEEYCSIKNKCDRGKIPPKNARRRRSMDKSENKIDGKAPNLVQNHGLSPLQDSNLRANPRVYSRICCELNVSIAPDPKAQRVLTEQNPADRKSYAKSVLANIPGLNDFQMMKPLNVDHIVNVVQVSGNRTTQNVPIQNTQTSTQITPHIQRIGQPRITDQKAEHSNSVTSTTITTSTTTSVRTATSQPSTLINILSQQIIRPGNATSNTVRRQPPLINILSQQIIRPSVTAKTVNNSTVPAPEINQVKTVVTTEQTVINQANSVVKNTNPIVKNSTAPTGQGGTILQFICKSSLPKFQQAFGKTVYQNNTEASESITATTDSTGTISIDAKKSVAKAVPVNVQPIQGSVIYSRQVPVGQTISLIPPGGTTRQVFRIATSNPEQISLVKDSVIHSKMSALLAAALQGRPKTAEGEVQVNSDDAKGTVTRPTLVQGARIVKPVQLQLQPNAARATPQTNLSSTTLEQLREFDMVYKQVKERSSTSTSELPTGENQEVAPQRISVTYVNQLPKYTQLSPVVVVTSYSSLQPAASPALSVTSQGSSSPCVTPASTPTLPKISSKTSKGKTLKSSPNNTATKSSPIPKPQQKPQEDEHTTQRIFDILAEYAEQLRNSPDLNNKPAPRRRSNPPTNPSQNSKRKKSSSGVKKSGQSSGSIDIDGDDITMGSEDSSGGGVVQLSVTDDEQSQAATINTTESSDNSSPPGSRQLILTEGGACGTQSRNLIIADSSVGEALKMPNTAVIMPGSYIMPVSMVKGAVFVTSI